MNIEVIDIDGHISAGSLLGTSGTKDIIDDINSSFGMSSEYFGSVDDIFKTGRETFVSRHIDDILKESARVSNITDKFMNEDVIKAILTEDDLLHIPPSMHMPILQDPEIRQLLKDERIDGFGILEEHLPEEDVYGRLIRNGYVEDLSEAMDENGNVEFVWEYEQDDPELDIDELDYVMETRKFIKKIIDTTQKDPTNYPMYRG